MPQGHAAAPSAFVRLMQRVTTGLERVRMYLDDAIAHDVDPSSHVRTIRGFLSRLEEHNLKLAPSKARIGATTISFLGHSVSGSGLRPDLDKVSALAEMPNPKDVGQLRSLLGGLSYYRKFLPNLAQRVHPLTSLLKKGVPFDFTPAMAGIVKDLLQNLSKPTVLAFPDWEAAQDQSRPFLLYCDACRDGFGAVLEQQQADGSIRPITFISRTTLPNERNWSVLDLEAGAIVWAIKRLRPYLFSIPFKNFHRS